MALDTEDRCKYGHQLMPGSTKINVGALPNGKPDVRLLRRHAVTEPGTLAPHGHDHRVAIEQSNYIEVKPEGCVLCWPQ